MTNDFVERWQSGALSDAELDAHYSRALSAASESVGKSAALNDVERQSVSSRLGTLKEIVDAGSIGALLDGLDLGGRGTIHSGYDDSVASVAIIDDEEYERREEQEARRREVFDAQRAVDTAATTTDYEGHVDPALLAVTADTTEQSADGNQELSEPAGFASYEKTPIAPPPKPEVPQAEPAGGPALQYPAAGVNTGERLDGADLDLAIDKKPLPRWLRVPQELAQKAWSRFRKLPNPVQIFVGLTAVVLLVVGLFGRGSTTTDHDVDKSGTPVVVNPNGHQPTADPDLVELQPTGGVGSNCDVKGFESARAFGKNNGDGWVCVRAHGIDGEFMEIDFGHKVTVCSVEFIPGLRLDHAGGTNEWNLHRLVSQVKILVPQDQTQPDPITIKDPTPAPVKQVFAPCFAATRISLIVQATKPPVNPDQTATLGIPGGDDDVDKTFALSALKFMGHDDTRR
ncbi:MAG: hypothetical protein WCE30_10195 [Mycobacterium sp.]